MSPPARAEKQGALVPARGPLSPAPGGARLQFLRIAGREPALATTRHRLRTAIAAACLVTATLALLGPSPLYRSQATVLLSGEAIGTGASLEGARIVLAYVNSEDAARDLGEHLDLGRLLAPTGLDPLSRLLAPAKNARAGALARELSGRIEADLDERSGHVRISLDAHGPAEAKDALDGLLAGAETLVNRMGDTSRSRRIVAAAEGLERAEAELARVLATRASRQEATRLLDPLAQAGRDAAFADHLRSESALLAVDRARLAALAPNSPRLAALEERQRALGAAAGGQDEAASNGPDAIAAIAADDSLKLSRAIAVKALEGAHRRLEAAVDAERVERIYLSTIAGPAIPDRPLLRPRGWQLAIAAALAAIALVLLRQRREVARA